MTKIAKQINLLLCDVFRNLQNCKMAFNGLGERISMGKTMQNMFTTLDCKTTAFGHPHLKV